MEFPGFPAFSGLLCLLSLVLPALCAKECYYPNGDPSDDQPCHPFAAESACCGTGWTCLSNDICEYTQDQPIAGNFLGKLFRGSCTDSGWISDKCPRFCYGESRGRHSTSSYPPRNLLYKLFETSVVMLIELQ